MSKTKTEERIIVLSDEHIFLFEQNKTLRRKHSINTLRAMIRPQSPPSDEFVLIFAGMVKDLHFKGLDAAKLAELQQIAKENFTRLDTERTLKIYEVPNETLHKFVRHNRHQSYQLPEDSFRQYGEEIPGSGLDDEDEDDELFFLSRMEESK